MALSGFTVDVDRTPDFLWSLGRPPDRTLLSASAALQEIREAKDVFVAFSQRKPHLTIFTRPQ